MNKKYMFVIIAIILTTLLERFLAIQLKTIQIQTWYFYCLIFLIKLAPRCIYICFFYSFLKDKSYGNKIIWSIFAFIVPEIAVPMFLLLECSELNQSAGNHAIVCDATGTQITPLPPGT